VSARLLKSIQSAAAGQIRLDRKSGEREGLGDVLDRRKGGIMTHPVKSCERPGKPAETRRQLLQLLASAVALLGLPRFARAVEKLSKASVAYREKPKGKQRCDNCRVWVPPNACKSVEGDIAPQGWCNIWREQVAAKDISPDDKGKLSQGDVAYQPFPRGNQRCDNCRVWVPPDACNSVQGTISPQGWCNIWRSAG
jgi:hypothetical protein